jgi:hypothetical protein
MQWINKYNILLILDYNISLLFINGKENKKYLKQEKKYNILEMGRL